MHLGPPNSSSIAWKKNSFSEPVYDSQNVYRQFQKKGNNQRREEDGEFSLASSICTFVQLPDPSHLILHLTRKNLSCGI